VIDTNKATYNSVLHAKQALERVGGRVIGAVMNKMKAAGSEFYYYQYDYGQAAPNGEPYTAAETGARIEEEDSVASRGK
jgi:hypothetical protein